MSNILIVDDQPYLRELLSEMLTREGYRAAGYIIKSFSAFDKLKEKIAEVLKDGSSH